MMFGGKSMGGGGGGGGGGGSLLRSVGRAVTRANFAGGALQEPNISSSTSASKTSSHSSPPRHVNRAGNNNTNLSRLSSPFASCNSPLSTVYGPATWPHCDDVDWVSVDDEYFLAAPVPSEDEVHTAVSALQQVFSSDSYYKYNVVRDKFASELDNDEGHRGKSPDFVHHVSPAGSEMDWIEPSLCTCDSKLVQCGGSERVYDAFRLLRTEPLVQKMVKSLSSDAAVWNAVLNNDVVRELREAFSAEGSVTKSQDESDEDSDEETSIVKFFFDGTRAKIMEVVEKITKLVSDLFRFPEDDKTATTEAAGSGGTDSFGEKLRTSFMLSIMVLLVVVVARAHKA